MDLRRIELLTSATAPRSKSTVDLARIELASLQCECSVLPLYHRPINLLRGENAALYQMSYRPILVVASGLEPLTFRM